MNTKTDSARKKPLRFMPKRRGSLILFGFLCLFPCFIECFNSSLLYLNRSVSLGKLYGNVRLIRRAVYRYSAAKCLYKRLDLLHARCLYIYEQCIAALGYLGYSRLACHIPCKCNGDKSLYCFRRITVAVDELVQQVDALFLGGNCCDLAVSVQSACKALDIVVGDMRLDLQVDKAFLGSAGRCLSRFLGDSFVQQLQICLLYTSPSPRD